MSANVLFFKPEMLMHLDHAFLYMDTLSESFAPVFFFFNINLNVRNLWPLTGFLNGSIL